MFGVFININIKIYLMYGFLFCDVVKYIHSFKNHHIMFGRGSNGVI